MKHIFISHAGEDSIIANRLAGDLKNAGHDTKVDTRELKLEDNTISFINDGIANAHTIIILYSKHTPDANWQTLEINSAVWNEIEQDGGTCIVVRLDDTSIPPILGPKVFGRLSVDVPESYRKILEKLCEATIPRKSATSIVSEAFRSDASNPFRRIRAEYFEDRSDLLAQSFAPLDPLKTGPLEDMQPCLLEGSRGTGKSMLLLSLRARNFLSRHKGTDNNCKIFGFYLKLSRGAICNAGITTNPDADPQISGGVSIQMADIASQEIVLCLLESLFSELSFCFDQKLIPCDRSTEKKLSEAAHAALFGQTANPSSTLDELMNALADMHVSIANFIRRRFIYDEPCPAPITTFDLDLLKRVVKLFKKHIPPLTNSMFVALFDEYENLFPYQQRIVNGFVKLGPPDISVKIAKKIGIADTSATTTGQELQEIHDYTRLVLVYDVEDKSQMAAYKELLKHFVSNILRSEKLSHVEITALLPEDSMSEFESDRLIEEVARLCKTSVDEFNNWPEAKRKEKLTYYGEAAIYRILQGGKGRHKDKKFSGFNSLAFVSSGVIRYFQEILGVAYYLTCKEIDNEPNVTLLLPPDKQSEAVHLVSQHNLTTLSRNVEKDGEALKYFLLDLGDCLRYKLLQHTSEPEAARLTIEDPERLELPEMAPLRRLFIVGTREGVFQTREGRPAFKPKHTSDPQPSEFNICRIFAPVLQISPRLRWRTAVKTDALLGLAQPEKRANTIHKLMMAMVKEKKKQDTQEKLL